MYLRVRNIFHFFFFFLTYAAIVQAQYAECTDIICVEILYLYVESLIRFLRVVDTVASYAFLHTHEIRRYTCI